MWHGKDKIVLLRRQRNDRRILNKCLQSEKNYDVGKYRAVCVTLIRRMIPEPIETSIEIPRTQYHDKSGQLGLGHNNSC